MKKVMLVLDYVRVHYGRMTKEGAVIDYFSTQAGNELWSAIVEKANIHNVNLNDVMFYVDFAYDAVPQILKQNKNPEYNSYKAPTLKECKEPYERLLDRINTVKPDLIIPMGGLGCKAIQGKNKITALRGKPEKVNVASANCGEGSFWVLPTFSQENVLTNQNNKKFQDLDLDFIMEYLSKGEELFVPKQVAYKTLYNTQEDLAFILSFIEDVVQNRGKTPEDAVAWDYETNTLRSENDDSKIISMSLSTEHGTGITFPFEHHEYPWDDISLEKIRTAFFGFLSSDVYKVGANIQFDIRFSKFHSKDYLLVKNSLDIQAGYYIGVSQEELDSSGLKTLAYHYTDMGGYDAPVEGYKKFFKEVLKTLYHAKKTEEFNTFGDVLNVQGGMSAFEFLKGTKYNQGRAKDKQLVDQDYLDETTMKVALVTAYDLMKKHEKDTDVVNPVDGENFTYDWIPYQILAQYASGDVDATRRIHLRLYNDVITTYDKWIHLYTVHYPTLFNTLADIEVNGMQVDVGRLLEIKEAFEQKRNEIYERLQQEPIVKKLEATKEEKFMIGLQEKAKKPADRDKEKYKYYTKYRKEEERKLKITSPDDKAMLLFGLTGYTLEPNRETLTDSSYKNLKNGLVSEGQLQYNDFKTGEDNVKLLIQKYPDFHLGEVLLEYQKAEKMVTTYTQSILDKTDSNNVLHGNLVSTRTETSTRGVA